MAGGPWIWEEVLRDIKFYPEEHDLRFWHRNGKTSCIYSYKGKLQYTDIDITKDETKGWCNIIIGCPAHDGDYGCNLMEWCEQQKYWDTKMKKKD